MSGQGSTDATTEDKMNDAIANAIRFATNSEIDGYFTCASTTYLRAARLAAAIGADDTVDWCKLQAMRCEVAAYRAF
jgi:hypothetical protein